MENSEPEVTCPLCKASRYRTECFARDELMNRGGCTYRYVRCLSCGAVYLNPLPNFPDIYLSDYPAWAKSGFVLFCRRLLIDLPQCRAVKRYKKRGSLLDVGCGMGTFLACLKRQREWQVEGIEPSSYGCEVARQKFGLSLWRGTLQDAPFKENSFDVIAAWDVLEHVESPRAFLKDVSRLLKKDGVFLMSMPHIGSIDYPLFQRRWESLQPPYHFVHLSLKHVIRFFREEGFTFLCYRTTLPSIYWTVFFSVRNALRRGEITPKTFLQKIEEKIRSLFRIPLGILVCFLGTPLFLIAHLFKKGDRMVVAVRKS